MKRRKRLLRVALTLAAVVVLFGLAQLTFAIWQRLVVPADAPRIAMSLADTWLNDLGVMRATYDQAMARAGASLVALEPEDAGTPLVPARIRALLERADGLLLTGGGDVDPALDGGDPASGIGVERLRDEFEIALIGEAERRGLPILGICRGCQLFNVSRGGTLRSLRGDEELEERHFGISGHDVRVESGSALAGLLGETTIESVPSFHGQAVGTPGRGVRVAARSEHGVIEAIESTRKSVADSWILCVQWHPELTLEDGPQLAILEAFVAEARRVRAERYRRR